MARPQLNPPCPGWQEDLPGPKEYPIHPPGLLPGLFNHQDKAYLEISRNLMYLRGVGIWLGGFYFLFTIAHVTGYVVMLLDDYYRGDWVVWLKEVVRDESNFVELIILFIGVWGSFFMIKMDISPPLDLPIRFNRARQRIYAYNYHFRWWNPFGRWRVKPVAYDWSQVRAERWTRRGATMHGVIIKWGVELSIVKPGTNQVIDRFLLGDSGADVNTWAYVCTYMQYGIDAIPPGPPRDHTQFSPLNLAKRLAPKVQWPADMDTESRTAP